MDWVLDKFTGVQFCPIIECNISSVRNGDRDAGVCIGAGASVWPSILAMLTEIAPFFGEILTGWRLPFLTSEPGTPGVRFLMSTPSPGILPIQFSAIEMGLESTLSAEFPFGRNWDWRYSLENGWNAPLKAGIYVFVEADRTPNRA
jgi:hypothetical protein